MEEELDVLLFKSPPSFPIVPFGFGTYLFALNVRLKLGDMNAIGDG